MLCCCATFEIITIYFYLQVWINFIAPAIQLNTRDSVEITNKMQPRNRIYYSTFYWRLNMFRAAYRSSSGALTVFAASGLHTHVVTGRSQVWVGNSDLTTAGLRID